MCRGDCWVEIGRLAFVPLCDVLRSINFSCLGVCLQVRRTVSSLVQSILSLPPRCRIHSAPIIVLFDDLCSSTPTMPYLPKSRLTSFSDSPWTLSLMVTMSSNCIVRFNPQAVTYMALLPRLDIGRLIVSIYLQTAYMTSRVCAV
jgi:hypothetical protein